MAEPQGLEHSIRAKDSSFGTPRLGSVALLYYVVSWVFFSRDICAWAIWCWDVCSKGKAMGYVIFCILQDGSWGYYGFGGEEKKQYPLRDMALLFLMIGAGKRMNALGKTTQLRKKMG